MSTTILGIDPGLVHTGCVALRVYPDTQEWAVDSKLVSMTLMPDGTHDIEKAAAAVASWARGYESDLTVIEAYKPRSHFDTDANMGALVNAIRRNVPSSKTLVNTGVKRVIGPSVMRQLGMWDYPTPSHHQDLRSAARIGLYGALKAEHLNAVIYELLVGVVDGTGWRQI